MTNDFLMHCLDMLTQHNRKTACLSPDHTFACMEQDVWSGDETKLFRVQCSVYLVESSLASDDPLPQKHKAIPN